MIIWSGMYSVAPEGLAWSTCGLLLSLAASLVGVTAKSGRRFGRLAEKGRLVPVSIEELPRQAILHPPR